MQTALAESEAITTGTCQEALTGPGTNKPSQSFGDQAISELRGSSHLRALGIKPSQSFGDLVIDFWWDSMEVLL